MIYKILIIINITYKIIKNKTINLLDYIYTAKDDSVKKTIY